MPGPTPSLTIVLFGAAGDLAERKLLPALWHAHRAGLLADRWRLVGTARGAMSDDDFRDLARTALEDDEPWDDDEWRDFATRLTYCPADLAEDDGSELVAAVDRAEEGTAGPRLHYLSTPPSTFAPVTERLGELGLLEGAAVVYEKPYGLDVASFDELDAVVTSRLDADRVFRLDHFLGKRSVQELVVLRTGTPALEAVWTAEHVRRVEIDVPETLSVGDRAGFYDDAGALRDVVATHLVQVVAVVAMDLPVAPEDLAAARTAVLADVRQLDRDDVVFGQYQGYLDTDGVEEGSTTETYAAVALHIDNSRWASVPFHLRHGKRMAMSHQRLTVTFHPAAAGVLADAGVVLDGDALVVELDRPETVPVDTDAGDDPAVSAHERLLLAAIAGDHRWFAEPAALRCVWERVDAVLRDAPTVLVYAQGSSGPAAAGDLVAPHRWTT